MHDDIAQRDQLASTLAVRHGRPAYLRRQDLAGWLFISPVLLFLLVFFLGPLIFAVVLVYQVLEWLEESSPVVLYGDGAAGLDFEVKESEVELVWVFFDGLTGSSELI